MPSKTIEESKIFIISKSCASQMLAKLIPYRIEIYKLFGDWLRREEGGVRKQCRFFLQCVNQGINPNERFSVLCGHLYRHNRTGGVQNNVLGGGAEDQFADLRPAVHTDDNLIYSVFGG